MNDTAGEYDGNDSGDSVEEEVEEFSPSTSLEELLDLQEEAEEEDGVNSHQLDIDAIVTKAIDMGASDIDVIPNDEVSVF